MYYEERMTICNKCPYNEAGICILCGCELAIKTKNPEEKCPHIPAFWGQYVEQKTYKQPPQLKLADGGNINQNPPTNHTCVPCQNRH